MSAAIASKDCDFEASIEKSIENSGPEVASGLDEGLVSVLSEKDMRRGAGRKD